MSFADPIIYNKVPAHTREREGACFNYARKIDKK
jgi:hypothetical protein